MNLHMLSNEVMSTVFEYSIFEFLGIGTNQEKSGESCYKDLCSYISVCRECCFILGLSSCLIESDRMVAIDSYRSAS